MVNYRNYLKIILMLIIIFSITTIGNYAYAETQEGKCGDNLTYKYENYILTIDGTGDMYDYKYNELPPWNTFNNGEFEGELRINEGVTGIGDYAFYQLILHQQELVIPVGVKSIGDCAFVNLHLEYITIPDSVKYIGDSAFGDTGTCCIKVNKDSYAHEWAVNNEVMYVIIGENNYEGKCGENAIFKYYENTKTLTISGTGDMQDYSETDLPPWFTYIKEANKIEIEKGITNIGDYAFYKSNNHYNNINYIIPEGVTSIGDYSFVDAGTLNYTIPNSVEYISLYAFSSEGTGDISCNFTFKVYRNSYAHNWVLKNTLGYSLLEDEYTSGKCGLNVYFEYDKPKRTLIIKGTGDMFDYSYEHQAPWRGYASEIEEVNVEEGITGIGENAFKYCDYASIYIPESVNKIAENSFWCYPNICTPEGSYVYEWANEINRQYESDSNNNIEPGQRIRLSVQEPSVLETLNVDKLVKDKKTLAVICGTLFILMLWALVRHNKKKKSKLTESNNLEEGEK